MNDERTEDTLALDPLTPDDAGCIADGVFGHDHIRATLADLLTAYWPAAAADPGTEVGELVEALAAELSDDDSETDDAIAYLNTHACARGVALELCGGDLLALPESEQS